MCAKSLHTLGPSKQLAWPLSLALASQSMKKTEILEVIGRDSNAIENESKTALCLTIESEEIDIVVTIPYEVHELYYEAKDKKGTLLVKDCFECYGELELEDYKESLQDIVDVIKSPVFRITNNGKTIETKHYEWVYFFGKYSS